MDLFSTEPILSLHGVTHRYSGRDILHEAQLTLHRGNRLGVIGVNGTGKTTLLRILAGDETPDVGNVVRGRGLRVGYLRQEFALDDTKTVRQSVEEGLAGTREMLDRYQRLSERLDESSMAEHAALQAEIDLREAWNLDQEVARIMQHLRVPDPERSVAELSGGERRRVTLCRTLVAHPDVLILDEPTNHLDAESIAWLEGFLASYAGSVVLVTHDRYFLDRVTNRMVELEFGRLTEYEGNYSDYMELKAERMAAEATAEHVRQMTLRRELQWIRKQPKARQAKQQARSARYEELLEQGPPEGHAEMELVLPMATRLGTKVVELKGVGKRIGDRPLIDGLDLSLQAGDRIGVIGPNGMGKTALMKLIMGQLAPDAGRIELGSNVHFVYADQGRTLLDPEKTVLEEVSEGHAWVQVGEQSLTIRSYLKRFLFTDEQANTPIKRLSGGEQNRVQLAKLLRVGGNVLIFDEPTNDLDLPTLRVLEEALVNFKGCSLVVSHDRYFLNRVATAILAFEGDGTIRYSLGSYDRYLEQRAARVPEVPAEPKREAVRQEKTTVRKLSYKETKELEGMESEIERAEALLAALEADLQDPALYAERAEEVPTLVAKADEARRHVEGLYARWEELEALR